MITTFHWVLKRLVQTFNFRIFKDLLTISNKNNLISACLARIHSVTTFSTVSSLCLFGDNTQLSKLRNLQCSKDFRDEDRNLFDPHSLRVSLKIIKLSPKDCVYILGATFGLIAAGLHRQHVQEVEFLHTGPTMKEFSAEFR